MRVPSSGLTVRLVVCVLSSALGLAYAQGAWDQAVAEGDRAVAAREYDRAADLYETAMGELGPGDPRRAEALMRLARVRRAQGDLAKPEELYREADPLAAAAWGRESAEYAGFLNEVGRYYHRRRKYEIAERFYRDGFAIRVRKLGKENIEVAESIHNLAILYENQALFEKAEVYYRTALELREKLLGPDNVLTIETAEHFARLLHRIQKHAEATPLEERARAVRRPLLDAAAGPRVDIGQVYGPGSALKMPELEDQTEPDYSDEARIGRHEGVVGVEAEIDVDGLPRNLRIVRILGLGLDEKALEAVRQWRFRPARLDGKKVACRVLLEINFTLL